MHKKLLPAQKIPLVLLVIFVANFPIGCKTSPDRSGPSILTGQQDSMKIVKTDLGYRVVLNGGDCVDFFAPELTGRGLPVDIRRHCVLFSPTTAQGKIGA
jgi:hypothetical protein